MASASSLVLGSAFSPLNFQMRASIMPLALLAILFAQWMCRISKEQPVPLVALTYAIIAITLGAATPLFEVRRAVMSRPAPLPLCSLVGVWDKQDNTIAPYASYLAPVSTLPAGMRQVPVTAGRHDPGKCWGSEWVLPEGWLRNPNA